MFLTVSLSIIRSLAMYTEHNLYDIYHCCLYSPKRLMMDRETVRNM